MARFAMLLHSKIKRKGTSGPEPEVPLRLREKREKERFCHVFPGNDFIIAGNYGKTMKQM